jgi:hypothetical protein
VERKHGEIVLQSDHDAIWANPQIVGFGADELAIKPSLLRNFHTLRRSGSEPESIAFQYPS